MTKKILLIENSPMQSRHFASEIEATGAVCLQDTELALAARKISERPNAAIVDWDTPEPVTNRIGGLNLLQYLHVPFVIFTAYAKDVPKQFAQFVIDKREGIAAALAKLAESDEIEL